LDVKNTGDFLIKNNLAELEMQADLEMIGTIITPELLGQIDFVSGEINAFGIDFEDATGYAQFKPGDALNPDVQLVAKKEIQEYEIHARVQGRSDNLRLRLDSTPSLDRREILAILFYGQTPDRLIGERRHQFTQTAAISQLASVLSKPINKISGLDVVEVSSRQVGSNTTVQRLSVGKSLSNRFNLLFTTDLGIEDPERAFELEYQLFDNFYFIAAKDIGDRDRYRFDISYRLQTY
jgi:translocation and assembly module TamB